MHLASLSMFSTASILVTTTLAAPILTGRSGYAYYNHTQVPYTYAHAFSYTPESYHNHSYFHAPVIPPLIPGAPSGRGPARQPSYNTPVIPPVIPDDSSPPPQRGRGPTRHLSYNAPVIPPVIPDYSSSPPQRGRGSAHQPSYNTPVIPPVIPDYSSPPPQRGRGPARQSTWSPEHIPVIPPPLNGDHSSGPSAQQPVTHPLMPPARKPTIYQEPHFQTDYAYPSGPVIPPLLPDESRTTPPGQTLHPAGHLAQHPPPPVIHAPRPIKKTTISWLKNRRSMIRQTRH